MAKVYILVAVIICKIIALEAKCPDGCTYCQGSNCYSCTEGYHLSQLKCVACAYTNCKTCNLYDCQSCKRGFWGGISCSNPCGTGCLNDTCFNNGECQCKDGFYSAYCTAECSLQCQDVCDKTNGQCKCKPGYHGPTCKLPCLTVCAECTNDTSCTVCQIGKYTVNCQQPCKSKCSDGSCDIYSGECINNATCSANCSNCTDGSNCVSCVDGYYGSTCETPCPYMCPKGCYQQSGICHSCNIGRYGEECDQNCSGKCKNGCVRYSGQCYECISGYHGDHCEHSCPKQCFNNTCHKTSGFCNLCSLGYTGETCENTTCPSNCFNCTGTLCSYCKPGFYGEVCQLVCNTNCSQDGCIISTGNCVKCKNSSLYGATCNETCSSNCLDNMCDRNTGECTKGCLGNSFGNKCDNPCPEMCARTGTNNSCFKNRTCLYGCEQNYYGPLCSMPCSRNCAGGIDSRLCFSDGTCINGCRLGYGGKQCNVTCSETCAEVASGIRCYDNGFCAAGCMERYSGERCDISNITVDNASDAGTSLENKVGPPVPVIAGSVGGVVVVLIVIGVVIVVVIRRKRRGKATSDQSARFDEDQPTSTNEYHTIGTLPERSTALIRSHVIANPNYDPSQDVLSLRRNGDNLQSESDTDADVLEIDEDERRTLARHQERSHSPVQQEENVYYIGLQDIQKRKITVDQLAEFVASKPFEYFQDEFDKFPYGLTRPHNEARKPDNVAKNRYQRIYAYDDTRVKVKGGKNDYINANFIDGFLKRNAYIASLGPMKKQMGDFGIFWKMIWQNKVERVVMVTNLDEEGKTKCEKYWPDVDDTKAYGDVLVNGLTVEVYAEHTHRTFKMTHGSNSRTLYHLHFTAWPDKGIPEDVTALIEFRQRVLRVQTKLDGPTLVHCSAGIGRTGTYIGLDILIHEGEVEGAVEIQGCVLNMRRNRVNMIQTVEQYEFLHRALVHALTFDCAPVTANQFENYVSKTGQQQRKKQFNLLMSISQHVVPEEQVNIARNKSLKNKNRRGADIPGDEYRPRLQVRSGTGDYINAVYMDSLKTKRHYIAAQSPLPGTVVDFLSLVYQENCPCIVSFEQTQESKDVGMYYPADNQVLSRGDFTVSSFKMDEQMNNCVLRRLVVENKKNGGQKKTVTHISYADWEQDKSVPNSPANFIQFIHNVEKLASEGTNRGPVVLHCLDGTMKCGLFYVVSTLLQKIAIDHEISVVNAVRKVKARRHGAIAAQDQFDFCYECVLQYIRSFGIYSNFAPL